MKLGELQTLTVEKTVPFGIYLKSEDPEEGRVLLPRSQVPEGVSEGDKLEVFLYKAERSALFWIGDSIRTCCCHSTSSPERGSKRDRKFWWPYIWIRARGFAPR